MTTILNLFYIIYKYYIYTKALTKAKYGVVGAQFGLAHEASQHQGRVLRNVMFQFLNVLNSIHVYRSIFTIQFMHCLAHMLPIFIECTQLAINMHFVETNHTIVSSLCSFSNSLMFFLYCSLVDLDIITNMFLVSLPRVKMWFHVFFYLFHFIEYLKFNTKKKEF